MRRLAVTALALALASMAAPVRAAPTSSGAADVEAGEAAWREQRWDDASAAFARAYEATGDPKYLYTRAQAERSAGRCDVALTLYEEFVATGPAPKAELAARRYMEECRAEVDAIVEPPTAVPDPVADPVGPVEAESEPDEVRPSDVEKPRVWYRDPLGDVLVGVGVAVAATGGALIGVAYRDAGRADASPDDRAFGEALDRAQTLERAGGVTLGIGAALLVGGIVRWAVVGSPSRGTQVGAVRGGFSLSGALPSLTGRSGAAIRRGTGRVRSRTQRRRR